MFIGHHMREQMTELFNKKQVTKKCNVKKLSHLVTYGNPMYSRNTCKLP